jgi:hypothetical protein
MVYWGDMPVAGKGTHTKVNKARAKRVRVLGVFTQQRRLKRRNIGPVSEPSYFLGDPPPDPRFLASLGALSLGELPFVD